MIIINTEVRGINKTWNIPEYSLQDDLFLEDAISPLDDYLNASLDRNEYNEIVLWDADGHPMSQVREALYTLLSSEKIALDLCVALDQHEEIRIQLRKKHEGDELDMDREVASAVPERTPGRALNR